MPQHKSFTHQSTSSLANPHIHFNTHNVNSCKRIFDLNHLAWWERWSNVKKMGFNCIIYSDSHSRIGARSLCKIYLRKGAIHAYNACSHHSTIFLSNFNLYPSSFHYPKAQRYTHFHLSPNEHILISYFSQLGIFLFFYYIFFSLF